MIQRSAWGGDKWERPIFAFLCILWLLVGVLLVLSVVMINHADAIIANQSQLRAAVCIDLAESGVDVSTVPACVMPEVVKNYPGSTIPPPAKP